MICEKTLGNVLRPKLSTAARQRIMEEIEAQEAVGDSQVATDIRFLLDYHGKVHVAAEDED